MKYFGWRCITNDILTDSNTELMAAPVQPTKEEWEQHVITHLPFRAWCPHCIRGRGLNAPHHRVPEEDKQGGEVAYVSLDYGFMPSKVHDEQFGPVLVLRDRKTRMTGSILVPAKGVEEFAVRRVIDFLRELGCGEVRHYYEE